MASFSIRWRASTKKDLRALSTHEVVRIVDAVEKLAEEPLPHGSQKLVGSQCTYRIRVGDYRVIYELLNSVRIVEVQRVRHRKDVYR